VLALRGGWGAFVVVRENPERSISARVVIGSMYRDDLTIVDADDVEATLDKLRSRHPRRCYFVAPLERWSHGVTCDDRYDDHNDDPDSLVS
jgi:hypothetical protein